jgi:hypothetical protein
LFNDVILLLGSPWHDDPVKYMVAVIKFVLIFEIMLLGFNQTIVLYVRKNEEQKPKEQRFKANENKPVMTE